MNNLHETQTLILKNLLFSPQVKYSDLKIEKDMENNLLNFHLKQLKKLKFIAKDKDHYYLTNTGKEYAGNLDTEKLVVKRQAKISVWVCCKKSTNNTNEYLICTRLKSPFYGCQGFISGKIDYGEKIADAATRELFEESGLKGSAVMVALKHYRVFDKNSNEMLQDKFMFLCLVENPTGEIRQSEEGKCEWVKQQDLPNYVTNHYESYEAFEQQLNLAESFDGYIKFIEEDYFSEKF